MRHETRTTASKVLLSSVLVLIVLSVAVALLSHRRALSVEPAAASSFSANMAVAAPPLYRIVGCRSNGTIAHREGPARKWVAIGFDDGPWTETAAFVRMLERSDARATFFMIGRQITAADRGLLLRELHDGDVLGDHTWSHPDLTHSTEVRSQLQHTIEAIQRTSGYTPCVFRPPYGDVDDSVVRAARSLGLSTVLWNVDPADYTEPGRAAIEDRVLAQVRPGSIVISHDGGGPRGQTLAAYPGIIRKLRARGYRIATITEMLGYRPLFERCGRDCDGIGLPRGRLPRSAIILTSP